MAVYTPSTNEKSESEQAAADFAATAQMAKLGNFPFAYKDGALSAFSRSTEYGFAEIDRAAKTKMYQKTGGNEENITIAVEFYLRKLSAFDEFRKAAAKREAMPLYMGYGEFLGYFIVRSCEETRADFFADGTHCRLSASLKLTRVRK
ncbi:hypothetical protein FACS189487_10960 [Campylobacterota bacterium]|nr:hypothetical protein FACS189487_10960 [Campylobacterota bacterium]